MIINSIAVYWLFVNPLFLHRNQVELALGHPVLITCRRSRNPRVLFIRARAGKKWAGFRGNRNILFFPIFAIIFSDVFPFYSFSLIPLKLYV